MALHTSAAVALDCSLSLSLSRSQFLCPSVGVVVFSFIFPVSRFAIFVACLIKDCGGRLIKKRVRSSSTVGNGRRRRSRAKRTKKKRWKKKQTKKKPDRSDGNRPTRRRPRRDFCSRRNSISDSAGVGADFFLNMRRRVLLFLFLFAAAGFR